LNNTTGSKSPIDIHMPQLFYVVGASGVGKDSLMDYARTHINGSRPLLFAHRYITRAAKEGNENHIYISPEEFILRKDKGLFALHWDQPRPHYGIGREIDTWMDKGFSVVVNGSRQYLPVAAERYPNLVTVVIEADPEVIRQRLENRGRETAVEIQQRIQRQPSITATAAGYIGIRNDGPAGRSRKCFNRCFRSVMPR
jgi:ribose 1,5-bisphosphokinase